MGELTQEWRFHDEHEIEGMRVAAMWLLVTSDGERALSLAVGTDAYEDELQRAMLEDTERTRWAQEYVA